LIVEEKTKDAMSRMPYTVCRMPCALSKRNIKIVIASTAKQSPYCGECSL